MKEEVITIESLSDKSLEPYYSCLEEWAKEMKEAGNLKRCWVEKMKDRGLGVQMACNSKGEYVGMIQYVPSEFTAVAGEGNYHIHCCWVHAYKGKGVGDWRKKGIGKALLLAAEDDIRSRGGRSVSAWGLSIPVWMKASWYKKQGYRAADKDGIALLMWKALSEDAVKPEWRKASSDLNPKSDKKLNVISYINGVCPAANIGHERIKWILKDYEDSVEYSVFENIEPEEIQKRGITDALYINGKSIPLGPPPKEKMLRKVLDKEIKKIRKKLRTDPDHA
jgi:GNAT superfamily N-acetyltransferase